MPQWMHDRADRIMSENPDMPKGEAFAIATQQMHALGKSPKSYGTKAGRREAKMKYKTPKDDQKTAGLLKAADFFPDRGESRHGGPTGWKGFRSGALEELGPGVGSMLGAGIGEYTGVGAVPGAALGYGIGSIPHMLLHHGGEGAAEGAQKGGLLKRVGGSMLVDGTAGLGAVLGTGAAQAMGYNPLLGTGLGMGVGSLAGAGLEHLLKKSSVEKVALGLPLLTKVKMMAPTATAVRQGEKQLAGQLAGLRNRVTQSGTRDMLSEMPAVRGGASPELAYNLMGQNPQAAKNELMNMHQRLSQQSPARGALSGASDKELEDAFQNFGPKHASVMLMREYLKEAASSGAMKNLIHGITKSKTRNMGAFAPNKAFSKLSFSESQYSGGMGSGPFMQRSPDAMPRPTSVAPPPEFDAGKAQEKKTASLARAAANAMFAMSEWQEKQANIFSARGALSKAQHVGGLKLTHPGPSVSKITKPIGYGRPQFGATKA